MTVRIKSIKPLENLVISVIFQNGVEKQYDMHILYPLFPAFRKFETNPELFYQVKIDIGGYGIYWNDDLDLSAEELWENGIDNGIRHPLDVISLLATNLSAARNKAHMTQKELAEITGIYQSDISKIERGLANPSLSTLQRLANGMGMELKIEFIDSFT